MAQFSVGFSKTEGAVFQLTHSPELKLVVHRLPAAECEINSYKHYNLQQKQLFWCSLLKAWHNSLQRIAFDEFTSTYLHNPVIYEEVTTKMKKKKLPLIVYFYF